MTQTAFGSRILPPVERALAALDAVTVEARRLTEPGEQRIRMGVSPLPRFEHQVIDVEPVVVAPGSVDHTPLELEDAGKEQFILVPDACGLTTFTTELSRSHELLLHTYPGEAASYRVLEEWARLGLGSAIIPVPSSAHRTRPIGRCWTGGARWRFPLRRSGLPSPRWGRTSRGWPTDWRPSCPSYPGAMP